MSVRLLTPADTAAFHALHVEGVTGYPTAFLRSLAEVENTSFEETADVLASGKMLGAFSGETLIGLGGLEQNTFASARHRALVGPFYVNPRHHGQGVAQTLMEAIVDRAKQLGVTQLELYVWAKNPRAIKFYTRNGFEKVGMIPRSVIIDGVPYDDLFMVRSLDR